jgi:catalase
MASKKPIRAPSKTGASRASSASKTSARSTVSGPSRFGSGASDAAEKRMQGANVLASAIPFNANKVVEYGRASLEPHPGASVEGADPIATGSTLTEGTASAKVGTGKPSLGVNPGVLPLDRVRVDGSGRTLTTNLGVPVADNQHSLKAGLRGPALLEDFILREKITHFDHERIPERIPERIVHAGARPLTVTSSATSR